MDAQRRAQYLDALGIQTWVTRESALPKSAETNAHPSPPGRGNEGEGRHGGNPPPPHPAFSRGEKEKGALSENLVVAQPSSDWETLQQSVVSCTACALHTTRTQTVFGVGNRKATWMIIGEAPGAEEDAKGEPFVGNAGKLLNEMLRALGLPREDVYIANMLKCRPPDNRDPKPAEVAQCEPFLRSQVALIQPKMILAVGRIAAQNLLQTDITIGRLRGRRFSYGDIPLVVTYHPAYLLRSPAEKRKAWDDLRFARAWLAECAAEK